MLGNISRPVSLTRLRKKKYDFDDSCFIIFFSCGHEIFHRLH